MEGIIFFVAGLFLGSFLNVVALSYDNVTKIIKGRSACPKCDRPLRWYELIPLISYLIQFGKCRSCQKKISTAYFWSELGTGLLLFSVYVFMRPLIDIWALLLLMLILLVWVVIFLHDAYTMLVPIELTLVSVVLTVVYHLMAPTHTWVNLILAAVIGAVIIALIRYLGTLWAKQEAMGVADVYVAAMVGFLVGLPELYVALLAAFIIGSVYGVAKGLLVEGSIKKVEVPFAPALLLGGLVALLFGNYLVGWYLGYI